MTNTKIKNKLQQLIAGFLIPVILGSQIFAVPAAQAQFGNGQNEPVQVTSIIAILVEESLIEDDTDYEGLKQEYQDDLDSNTLRERIYRFARDTQLADPFTKSVIIRVKENQHPSDITQALETLYSKGDQSDQTKSRLDGVIIIGDVPLPVVNKNGFRFTSMLPYTDFIEPVYIYNETTRDFEYNSGSTTPKVEAWHGVIKAPTSDQYTPEKYAYYFDKNHLFHIGNEDFAVFDQNLLYADMIWEQEMYDEVAGAKYENYTKYMEDLAYRRFSKELVKEIIEQVNPEGDGIDDDLDGFVDEDLSDGIDNDNDGLTDEDGGINLESLVVDPEMFNGLPDAYSKDIVFSYAQSFNELFKNYLQKTNDLIRGTGRYESYDSLVELIATKDLHTQEYLRMVNDAVERRVDEIVKDLTEPARIINSANITGKVTFDDDSTANLISWGFTNNNVKSYTDPDLGTTYNTVYYYGKPAPELESAQECTLFRGNAELNRVYNLDTKDNFITPAEDYGYCYSANATHPERCFPEISDNWIYDKDGAMAKDDISKYALGLGGCYDFRETSRFNSYLGEVAFYILALGAATTEAQKAAIPLPGSKYRPNENITLFGSPEISFKDILDIYGGFDGVDNDEDGTIDEADEYNLAYKINSEDPYEIGLKILGSRKNHFVIQNPPFEDIKQIDLYVNQIPTLSAGIDSLVYHKEPTDETIRYQLQKGTVNSLPVDDPRYVSFVDRNGVYREIFYPSSFDAANYDDYLAKLEELEQFLASLPDATPEDIEGKLTEVIKAEETLYTDESKQTLDKTTYEMVDDIIWWENAPIDKKHLYAFKNYLDKDKDAYTGETTSGYEYFYFTADGTSSEVNFALNKNPTIVDNDTEWLDPNSKATEPVEEPEDTQEEAGDEGVILPAWLVYLIDYMKEISKLPKGLSFQPACGDAQNNVVTEIAALAEELEAALSDSDENGIPDGAEKTTGLLVEFQDESNMILAGSTQAYNITVTAVDNTGSQNYLDSYTEVYMALSGEEPSKANIYGAENVKLINGQASFKINATENPGSFTVRAVSINTENNIVSNVLNLKNESRKIRVLTYENQLFEPPSYEEEILQNYSVRDEQNKTIAEIDPETGKVKITDSAYETEVHESTADKPMQVAIIKIQSGAVIASVTILPQIKDQITIRESSADLSSELSTISGVHVKDADKNDEIIAYQDGLNVYIIDNRGEYAKRIAKITSSGNVYLGNEFFIDLVNESETDKPYLFAIEDAAGNDLFQFAIGYKLGSVTTSTNLITKLIGLTAYAQSTQEDDTDDDGLKDIEEINIGTSRIDKDTDDDDFNDGEELTYGYDPLKKDLRLFADLDPQDPSYAAFTNLILRGIVEKSADNLIRPDDNITREEFVQMVLGITCVNCSSFSEQTKIMVDTNYSQSQFPDTNISEEYQYCVKEAKNTGVVSGYEGGTDTGYFKPEYFISRAEATKVILEAAGIDSSSHASSSQPWYYRYVITAQENSIYPKQISPADFTNWIQSPITRAEFAIMVNNAIKIFDCYSMDNDNDGLPNNFENYQYNTDPEKSDTDDGGLDDLSETIRNKNPLDPSDDLLLDDDEDTMLNEWENEYGLDPYNPDDAKFDNDKDGLINVLEFENNTNPLDPDTDDGGINDGDEVLLQETDPLNGDDDYKDYSIESGISAFGNIVQDIAYRIIEEGETTQVPDYINSLPADGESKLFLVAEILDENGDIAVIDSNSTIEFVIQETSSTGVDIQQKLVKADKGVALTQITSTKKAGIVDITARRVGSLLPVETHQVFVEPLEPVGIFVDTASPVIKTGGLSKTQMKISLKDKYENLVNNDFYEITVWTDGPGKLDISADTQTEEDGVQLQSFEGVFNVDLYSTQDEGDITVHAKINDLYNYSTVRSLNDVNIVLSSDKETLKSDGQDSILITAEAQDSNGEIIEGFNQPITFSYTSEFVGNFAGENYLNLENGTASINFISSTQTGPLEITATVPGINPGTIAIKTLANEPVEIKLHPTKENFDASTQDPVEVVAKLYDKYGNFVDDLNDVQIDFRITQATEKYAKMNLPASAITTNGKASGYILGNGVSGPVHVIASSEGLASGTLEIKATEIMTGAELIGNSPDVLYGTMLGGSFGDTTADNYLAGEMLFKGTLQAVTAMTVPAKISQPLMTITPNGGLAMEDSGQIQTTFIPSNGTQIPNRILVSTPDTQENIAELYYQYPQDLSVRVLENTNILGNGLYIIPKTDDEIFEFKENGQKASITLNGLEAVTVNNNGNLNLADNLFGITVKQSPDPFLVLEVNYSNEIIAEIIFAVNIQNNITITDDTFEYQIGFPYTSGIYLKQLKPFSDYEIESYNTTSSTHDPKGAQISSAILEISTEKAPGFSYTSLEDIYDKQGVGFDGDNKHSLFFAAGNSIGEANIPYVSDAAITLGDPTVRLVNENLAGGSGFTNDIGKPIYYSEDTIQELILADYNNDGLEDVILASESGEVRLLEHQLSAQQFEDKGKLLDLANGIYSGAAADFNNDGYDDLLFSTKESCIGEEVCIYIFENNGGTLNRINVPLDVKDKISSIKIGDLNNDNYPDIITAEFSGDIKVFYNENGTINPTGQLLENVGLHIDPTKDLKEEFLISYSGMPTEDESILEDDFNFEYLQLEIGAPGTNPDINTSLQNELIGLGANASDFIVPVEVAFIYADADPIFGTEESSKQAVDINGVSLAIGDKVVYTITLTNTGTSDINNLMINDILPDALEMNKESIKCLQCEDTISVIETGLSLRPYVIGGLSIPAGESKIITYETSVTSVPEIDLDLNKDYDAAFLKDEYLDINVRPKENSSGNLLFFYSVSKNNETGRITYGKYIAEPVVPTETDELPYDDEDSFPFPNGKPDELERLLKDLKEGDEDSDGIPNNWDEVTGNLENAANAVSNKIKEYTCDGGGGCLPVPMNNAFLAPGTTNNMGAPASFDPNGKPIFTYDPATLKVFLSPTLTGNLGNSVCVGGFCWSVVIPLLSPEVCKSITDAVTNAMANASNVVSSVGSSTSIIGGGGILEASASVSGRSNSGGMSGSSVLGNYSVSGSGKTNSRTPGFPSVIADWFAKQLDEVVTKLSDLPDLYVLYPDPNAFVSGIPPKADFKNLSDVLNYVNKLPIIEIESRQVTLKIPALSEAEIIKMQTKLKSWVANAKREIQRVKIIWPCKVDNIQSQTCIKAFADIDKTIQSVERNIKVLEEYKNLPRKILEWREIQTKYLNEVLCYVDTIINYMGGYMKKQTQRIKEWTNLVKEVKEMLKTWAKLNGIMMDYMKSCDTCSSDRYTLLENLAKIFTGALPELPIVPFPKWPDFYFDFSKIQLGYKIIWPDVTFRTEQIILPDLPDLQLPDLPNINLPGEAFSTGVTLPEIPVLPSPPALPELPSLPPMPMPQLPDIPKPPKIPTIDASIKSALGSISKIIKLMCLLKKSFMPVPMTELKTHIEALSARPLSVVFPMDLAFKFQTASITYPFVEKIKVTSKVDFRLETEQMYDIVNDIAKEWNSIVTDVASTPKQISTPTTINLEDAITYILVDEYINALTKIQEASEIQKQYMEETPESYTLTAEQKYISLNKEDTEKTVQKIKESIKTENLPAIMGDNKLVALRSALIAYTDDQSNSMATTSGSQSYDRMLAMIDKSSPLENYLAKANVASLNSYIPSDLLALNTNAISSDIVDEETATGSGGGQPVEGLYVYNSDEGVNERILMYEGETSMLHNALIADMDEDTDEDIIYSYGGNVYLKENFKEPKNSKYSVYNGQSPVVRDLEEFIPAGPSVHGFGTSYDSGTSTDFSWEQSTSGITGGYEIIYKDSLNEVGQTSYTPSNKIVVLENITTMTTIGRVKDDIEITAVNGSFTVNGESTLYYGFEDTIDTSSDPNTEVVITFSDSSQLILGPDSSVSLPQYQPGNFEITVHKGIATFKSNFFTNLFLQEGSKVVNQDGDVTMEYKNGDIIKIEKDSYFFASNNDEGIGYINNLNGSGTIKTTPRYTVTPDAGKAQIRKGDILHLMENSVIVIAPPDKNKQLLALSKNTIMPVSENYFGDLTLQVASGKVEVLDSKSEEKNTVALEEGMLVKFGDFIEMTDGYTSIQFINGASTYLGPEDTLVLEELVDPENPFVSLDSEEANYYAQIYAFDENGNRSNPSEVELLAPQLCSDKQAPYAEAGPAEKTVIIHQTLTLDASSSFDTEGEITSYYLDLDKKTDSDGNGNPADDKDMSNDDPKNPIFMLGPFEEISTETVVLNVVDESLNKGKQIITIKVVIPEIILDESSKSEEVITGSIDPVAKEIPIALIRNREGLNQQLITDKADENGMYLTDEEGNFKVENLNFEDKLILRNSDGEIVAEIDDKNGRITIVDDRYYVDVLEAVPPVMPTRLVVKEKSTDVILLTILLIPDQNTDVTIDETGTNYSTDYVAPLEGVHIVDRNTNDQFVLDNLPASDPNFTGAAEIKNSSVDKRISIVDAGGNVYFLTDKLDLQMKSASPQDPLTVEMLYDGLVIAEIYIAINNGKAAEITDREKLGLPAEGDSLSDQDNDGMSDYFEFMYGFDARNPGDALEDSDGDGLSNLEEYRLKTNPLNKDSDGDGFTDSEEVAFGKDPTKKADSSFDDVSKDHPYYDSIVNLSQRNILRGEFKDGSMNFNPDNSISRKDFADIILKMLCIIPRQESYKEPSLFSDIQYSQTNYYYAVIKEAVYQGFITGYVGEVDAATGLSPFKPDETISRAEAVKIVLEALEKQKIVTLRGVTEVENSPWYTPYMALSQDLSPILLEESALSTMYILTPEEAKNPEASITRAEFAAIADRVLSAFDCYGVDDDGDGMPSVWELANNLNPLDPSDAVKDPDNEGLINLDEYRFGTNPFDPDTDDGGTNDKNEVDNGTNPINFAEDDPFDDDNDGLTTKDEIEIYGTDPYNPDTDNGGIMDGMEVARGTNPLDTTDDMSTIDKDPRSGLEEGIYIVTEACNSCPCNAVLDHAADLIPGDIFFAVIGTRDLSTIFAKSNELKYE
ncbi:hypothetical protein C0416_04325 [bacterium]|nr:hypothetical protein [bacterium]